ncbi:MAG: FAD-dependent oxidoreductase [Coprobacillaceae bacterium]
MKVVIIGAVAGGMSTAAKLKRNLKENVEVVVYEKGNEVSYGACGLPFYVSDIIKDETTLFARTVEQFIESGIDLHVYHEVVSVDSEQKTVTVKNLKNNEESVNNYDVLVIASGARVNRAGILDVSADNYFGVRSVNDAKRIKELLQSETVKEVAVIGGGFIGLEMLEAIHHYGKKASLIQREERIFIALDEDITDKMQSIIEDKGVSVYTNARILKYNKEDNKITSLEVEIDGVQKTINAQLVLNCAGIIPNTEFINNIDKAPNGAIKVNSNMETSIKGIYSAGDCSIMKSSITEEYVYAPLGTNANKQGRIIADIISGIEPKPFKLLHSTALKLFDYDVASIGVTEAQAKAVGMNVKQHKVTANSYAGYYGKEQLDIKVLYETTTRKIVGVQCIGQGTVVPRANYYAIAIYAGLAVDQMGMLDLAYSPPFNGVWDAALIASNTIK